MYLLCILAGYGRSYSVSADLGKPGQIVEVDPLEGYMQYILPRRALYATPQNIKKVKLLSDSEIDKHSTISAYKVRAQHNWIMHLRLV